MFDCKKCGAKLTVRSVYCSSGTDLICQGQEPVPGCGAILTAEERHYYGYSCEKCQEIWNDRIEAWRHGGEDAVMDERYGVPNRVTH